MLNRTPAPSTSASAPDASSVKDDTGSELRAPRPYWGKYRGRVVDNVDLLELGRLMVQVPSIPGAVLNWALPCSPYAGPNVGLFALPPIGANVWVEFEGGNPSFPIWAGCFWEAGEVPVSPAIPAKKVLRTELITIELDDTPGGSGLSITGVPSMILETSATTIAIKGEVLSVETGTVDVVGNVDVLGDVEIEGNVVHDGPGGPSEPAGEDA